MRCGSAPLIVTDGITTVDPTTEVDFTSGAVVTDLGGGIAGVAVSSSFTPVQARYSLTGTAVVAGAGTPLTWALLSGTGLLDLTVPTIPTALAAGVYAVTIAAVSTSAMTLSAGVTLALSIDPGATAPFVINTAIGAAALAAAVPNAEPTVAGVWPCRVSQAIRADLTYYDTSTRNFSGFANVVKLT
jgi:hypothetical protein